MSSTKSHYLAFRRGCGGYCQKLGRMHKSRFGEYFLLRLKPFRRPLYVVPSNDSGTKFAIYRDRKYFEDSDVFSRKAGQAVLPFRGATYLKTNLFRIDEDFKISLIPNKEN